MSKSITITVCVFAGLLAGANAPVVASLGAVCLLFTRRLKPNKIYACIDFNLLIIFSGLFVIIGGVESSGLVNWLMNILRPVNLNNFNLAVLLLKYFMPQDQLIWWAGLGIFSTLAGNLTLFGSIANLIVAETAKKDGVELNFGDYFRIGFPLTVLLIAIGLLYFNLYILQVS